MLITVCKSKIHRAKVTAADLNYVGSITIDKELLRASGIFEYEKVQVLNIDNGVRIETYAIIGESGSGIICLNGAAAHHFSPDDKIIIIAYGQIEADKAEEFTPKIVFVDTENKIAEIKNSEDANTFFKN